jgi:two-component system C4-dicarboxylate transport sensor histidine kinase DctB
MRWHWRFDWMTLAILALLLSVLIAVFGTNHMMGCISVVPTLWV